MEQQDCKITLNVGGKIFVTYRNNLTKYPDTMLGRMYLNHDQFKASEVEFFDRSYKLFDHILNFYRTGILCKPELVNREIWQEELQYWGLIETDSKTDLSEMMTQIISMIEDGKLKGERGERGMQGCQGMQGEQGIQGMQGMRGNLGPQGERGIQGVKGDQGPRGQMGPIGFKGKQGPSGQLIQ